jgi:hypothetical protein
MNVGASMIRSSSGIRSHYPDVRLVLATRSGGMAGTSFPCASTRYQFATWARWPKRLSSPSTSRLACRAPPFGLEHPTLEDPRWIIRMADRDQSIGRDVPELALIGDDPG